MTFKFIKEYLFSRSRLFGPDEYQYASYNTPNTMIEIHNDMFELMARMSPATLKTLVRIVSLVKRNTDPVLACSCMAPYSKFEDLMSKRTWVSSMKELYTLGVILKTPTRSLIILSVNHINKTFKPKLDDVVEL